MSNASQSDVDGQDTPIPLAGYDVVTIADEVLKRARRKRSPITPLQLMKITYIAQGWRLALSDLPLFNNRIEAWKYGPVIPDLYRVTQSFGQDPIPFDLLDHNPTAVDVDTEQFLDDVLAKYGSFSGYMLSNLTHKCGSPWDMTLRTGRFRDLIPNTLIKHHYDNLYRLRTEKAAA